MGGMRCRGAVAQILGTVFLALFVYSWGGKGSSSASGALAVTVAQYSGEVTPKDLVKGEDSGTVVRDRLRNSVAADGPAKRARAASDLAEGAMTAIVGSGLGTV